MDVQHKASGKRRTPTPRERADFERDLAHKMGNLLQVVNGNLELLAGRIEDDQLRGYLNNAQVAAARLAEIAQGLNDRVESDGR